MRLVLLVHLVLAAALLPLSYVAAKDIGVPEITIDNYKEFVEQLKQKLPVGTPREKIELYLTENNFEFGYDFTYDRVIVTRIKNIRRYLLFFTTDLSIKFRLNEDKNKLTIIDAELVHTGF